MSKLSKAVKTMQQRRQSSSGAHRNKVLSAMPQYCLEYYKRVIKHRVVRDAESRKFVVPRVRLAKPQIQKPEVSFARRVNKRSFQQKYCRYCSASCLKARLTSEK